MCVSKSFHSQAYTHTYVYANIHIYPFIEDNVQCHYFVIFTWFFPTHHSFILNDFDLSFFCEKRRRIIYSSTQQTAAIIFLGMSVSCGFRVYLLNCPCGPCLARPTWVLVGWLVLVFVEFFNC